MGGLRQCGAAFIRFHNVPVQVTTRRRFLQTLGLAVASTQGMLAGDREQRRSRWDMIAYSEDPVVPSFKPQPALWDDHAITAAWIGHATVLVNFLGVRMITDPVFSDRIGLNVAGLFTIGPKRLVYPALPFDELPPIDLILLSHAHMDHLDLPTLDRFDRKIPLIIAQNTADVIADLGFETVYELDWGEWANLRNLGIRVEALQVKHFGWRYPWERDRSRGYPDGRSYNAYLISRNDRHIVFGGDTAYHEHFRKVAERTIDIELAMMPIGAYDPWITNHCNPEQALAMSDHMHARRILPIHWNTFIQSEEPTAEPMTRMKEALAAQPDRLALDAIGQTWSSREIAGVPATG